VKESLQTNNGSPGFQTLNRNRRKKVKNKTKVFLSGLILLLGLFAAACPERRSIADIEANPSKYLNKEVAIAGVVQDSYGVNVPLTNIRGGAYKVSDGTGSIWIVTENSVPAKGTQLGIKGKVQNGVNWKGKNYGLAIMEDDRRFKKSK
jgi:glycerol kinase